MFARDFSKREPQTKSGQSLYQFDLNPSSGIDITLALTDVAGSANAVQTQSRLVNDLDLE